MNVAEWVDAWKALKQTGGPKPIPMRVPYVAPTGWKPMCNAPKGKHVQLLLKDGSVCQDAHWAQDLSGEEQPAYSGWFYRSSETLFDQVYPDPVGWRDVE